MGITGGQPPPKPRAESIMPKFVEKGKEGDNMAITSGGKPMDDKCKKGGCVMNKVYCVLFGCAIVLGFGSFLIDWVDVTKNRDESRVEFYINTGKIGEDVNGTYEKVCKFFE